MKAGLTTLASFLLVGTFLWPCRCEGEPTRIEVPLFEGGMGKDFFLECAREYEKIRPGVVVDLYLDPRINDKIQVRVLEGTFFEMTNAFLNYWPLIHNGDVLDLNEYLEKPNWGGDAKWKDTFLPGSMDSYTENGKVYGLPLGYYVLAMWYNKAMFARHGWELPKTWDELYTLCERIKAAGIAPIAFQGRYPDYAKYLYDHAYYDLTGAEGWRKRFDLAPGSFDCEAGIRSLALVRRLAKDYFQPGCLGMSHTEAQLQFFLSKTAMIPCGSWLKSEMKGKIPEGFELGAFNLPTVPNSKGDPTAVGRFIDGYFVMSHSRHPQVAVDFLRFMTSRKMAGRFSRLQDIPTSIKGASEGNLTRDMDDVLKMVNSAKTSYGVVAGEGFPEMAQVYTDKMTDVVGNFEKSPQTIAREMENAARTIRSRFEYPDRVTIRHRWEPAVLLGLLGLGALTYVWQTARKVGKNKRAVQRAGLQKLSLGNVLLFVGPALAIYSLFVILPSLRSFSWSMHQWNGLTHMSEMPFKGLLNFRRLLFESDAFWIAIKNNLFIMIVVPLFVIPISLFLAACVNRGVVGAGLFRVVFFFPNILGGVAATLLWLHLYNPQGGLVNSALEGIGNGLAAVLPQTMPTWPPAAWMVKELYSMAGWFQSWAGFTWLEARHLYWSLIPISVWGVCGFNMVLYLAAMESIPETYYEAATIDGASKWRQFWTITVPLIWEILAISIVFLVIGGMKAFEVIWLLTNQQTQTQSHVISTLMVQTMFKEYKVGEAAALAVLLFLMVFIGTAATLRGLRREAVEM